MMPKLSRTPTLPPFLLYPSSPVLLHVLIGPPVIGQISYSLLVCVVNTRDPKVCSLFLSI